MPEVPSNRVVTQRIPRANLEAGPALSVRYWQRMRPHKVYPVVVSTTGGGPSSPATVRLVMAGAQVVPAEQPLDAANPREELTFYVTPLAKGNLRAECIEVVQGGAKIQELPIPCQVCTQKPALVLLLCALLIPWLMLHFLVYAPIGYQTPLAGDGTEEYIRPPAKDYAAGEEGREPRAARITHFLQDNTPFKGWLGDSKQVTSDGAAEKEKDQKKDAARRDDDPASLPERAYVELVRTYRGLGQPLAFYVFFLLVICSLVSFIGRQERLRTVRGRPLTPPGSRQ
jgi:hypothetical protein